MEYFEDKKFGMIYAARNIMEDAGIMRSLSVLGKYRETIFLMIAARITHCNRRLIFVHFRRNKSDPDRRFNSDPFPHVEEGLNCTGWRCGE